ncbi:hypothetical protein FQA47_022819 [Oryzias melastigma]|uniref:Uncharacterized protein n=1 Tax=Oryzias melastigma TaxID=30732 RepID=A0A834F8S4_ORYME|nr:hypothetical protein FQA47_022819 [Oryzias melastigma]
MTPHTADTQPSGSGVSTCPVQSPQHPSPAELNSTQQVPLLQQKREKQEEGCRRSAPALHGEGRGAHTDRRGAELEYHGSGSAC